MKLLPAVHFAAAVGEETDGDSVGAAAGGDGLRFRGLKWWMTQTSRRTRAASRKWTMCSLENAEIEAHRFHFNIFHNDPIGACIFIYSFHSLMLHRRDFGVITALQPFFLFT